MKAAMQIRGKIQKISMRTLLPLEPFIITTIVTVVGWGVVRAVGSWSCIGITITITRRLIGRLRRGISCLCLN